MESIPVARQSSKYLPVSTSSVLVLHVGTGSWCLHGCLGSELRPLGLQSKSLPIEPSTQSSLSVDKASCGSLLAEFR